MPKIPKNPIFNYIGVAVAVVSIAIYGLVKPNANNDKEEPNPEEGETEEVVRCGKCVCLPISKLPSGPRRLLCVKLVYCMIHVHENHTKHQIYKYLEAFYSL